MTTQNLVQRKMQITLRSAAPAADRQGKPQLLESEERHEKQEQ